MSNYTKITDFAVKDGLPGGDPLKKVRGLEIDAEFEAIETAVATKADASSPALTGTPTAPTAVAATNTTQIATTAHVKTAIALAFQGMIVLWSGAQAAIPAGWVLCDGNNATPDLRDRFIVGAGNSYAVGNAAGSIGHTTAANGAHNHTGNVSSTALTIAQMPAHTHTTDTVPAGAGSEWQFQAGSGYNVNNGEESGSAGGGEGHTHTITSDGTHTHTVSDHRPPYYALCYIMKT